MYDEDGIIEEKEKSAEEADDENDYYKTHPWMTNYAKATPEQRKAWQEKAKETRKRKKQMQEDANVAKDSIRYLLSLSPTVKLNEQLAEYGIAEENRTNMMAMILKQFVMAVKGNTKSFESLMKYAGYEPGESRRDEESKVRIAAIQGGQANALSSGEEGNDVIIYLPEIEKVEAVADKETESEDKGDEEI